MPNEIRPIDANALRSIIEKLFITIDYRPEFHDVLVAMKGEAVNEMLADVIGEIDDAPTIDLVEYFAGVDRIKQCPNCRYQLLGEEKPGWISVKERLPGVDDFIGVSRFNSAVRVYHKRSWNKEFTVGGLDIKKDIVWWMPLPEPPKEAPNEGMA